MFCHALKRLNKESEQILLGDSMEIALVELAQMTMTGDPDLTQIAEIPFDTYRKRLSLLYQTPEGDRLYCKGVLETGIAFI